MRTAAVASAACAAMFLGLALLPLASSNAAAEIEVILVRIDPPTKQVCMREVDNLRGKTKNVAGTALAVAHAQEAEEACQSGDFAMAEEALVDGYRWLGRKKGKGR